MDSYHFNGATADASVSNMGMELDANESLESKKAKSADKRAIRLIFQIFIADLAKNSIVCFLLRSDSIISEYLRKRILLSTFR